MMMHRQYHAHRKNDFQTKVGKDIVKTGTLFGTLRTLIKLEKEYGPERIIFFYDSTNETFRNSIYPEYKSHRKAKDEEFLAQVKLTIGILAYLGISQITHNGVEADDLILSFQKGCLRPDYGCKNLIVSTDKDLYITLEDDEAHMLVHTPKQKIIDRNDFIEKFGGITPKQFPIYLALIGDKSDNIPPVNGIGPRKAIKLMSRFENFEKISENLTPQQVEQFELNLKLTTLVSDISVRQTISLKKLDNMDDFWDTMDILKFHSMTLDRNKRVLEEIHEKNKGNQIRHQSKKAV